MSKVTNRPDMVPGYYQAVPSKGLKTGRPSPRVPIRPSRSDQVNAAHGIVSTGSIEPQQGQLMDLGTMPAIPDADLVRRAGAAPSEKLAEHKGFMPGLKSNQKIRALRSLATSRDKAGTSRGGGAVAETMEDRAAVHAQGNDRAWYAARNSAGHIAPGDAGNLIEGVASRQGVPHSIATRTTAITSPRTAWDEPNAGPVGHSGGMSRPNLNTAENVISAVKSLGPDPTHARVELAAGGAAGLALPEMAAKAGHEMAKGSPQRNIPVWNAVSAKVPNFEQSLQLDNSSKTVQAQAAKSYTVDSWDTKVMGADDGLLKRVGGYNVAAMTGRRAALKAGELPPRAQSSTWEAIRNQGAPQSMGTHGLFKTNRGGDIIPNPLALPDATSIRRQLHEGGTHDDRSDFAKKMGTEF